MIRKFMALVPARAGSKSILDKNMQLVGRYSLVARAVRAGLGAGIEYTFITTNSRKYGEEAAAHGGKFDFLRPDNLSLDSSTDNDYMEHFVKWCQSKSKEFEFLVILRPTSPFREPKIIKQAMSLIGTLGQSVCSLRSAHVAPESPYKWFKRDDLGFFHSLDGTMSASDVNMPRQDFEDIYIPNGYVDIVRWENIINGSFWGENMYVFETPMCHEVDSKEQLEICQVIASNKESELNGSSS